MQIKEFFFSFIPVDRWGYKLKKNEDNKYMVTDHCGNYKETEASMYTPIKGYKKIWIDSTLSNYAKIGACYIETTTPIPVKPYSLD